MKHMRQAGTIVAALAEPAVDVAWAWLLRRLQSSADREAARFLRYHPGARIR